MNNCIYLVEFWKFNFYFSTPKCRLYALRFFLGCKLWVNKFLKTVRRSLILFYETLTIPRRNRKCWIHIRPQISSNRLAKRWNKALAQDFRQLSLINPATRRSTKIQGWFLTAFQFTSVQRLRRIRSWARRGCSNGIICVLIFIRTSWLLPFKAFKGQFCTYISTQKTLREM